MHSMMSGTGSELFFWLIVLIVFGLLLPALLLWSIWKRQEKQRPALQQDRAQPHESWSAYEQGYRASEQEQATEMEGNPSISKSAKPSHANQDEIEITQRW